MTIVTDKLAHKKEIGKCGGVFRRSTLTNKHGQFSRMKEPATHGFIHEKKTPTRWYYAEAKRQPKGDNLTRNSMRDSFVVYGLTKNYSVEERFYALARNWKRGTAISSLGIDKITYPDYLTIIGLGITYKDQIIRLILEDLEKKEEYWHYALKSITNENPVPKGKVNNLRIVRQSWLEWGKQKQLI